MTFLICFADALLKFITAHFSKRAELVPFSKCVKLPFKHKFLIFILCQTMIFKEFYTSSLKENYRQNNLLLGPVSI